MDVVELTVDYGGRPLTLQTGKIAKQSDASVLVRYGETVVLVAVVSSKSVKEGQDFFPLTVDFHEKYYSAGRVPGGFFKREAKPSDRATLAARCIDRPCRPLFPEDYLCDTNVTVTVLSSDGVNDADVAASIGASAALHMSDIPWAGPIGSCRVGRVNGEFVANISPADVPSSDVDLLVSGVKTGVIMVEGSSKEVSEQVLMDAIDFAHREMQKVIELIEELREKTGNRAKRDYDKPAKDEALKKEMRTFLWAPFQNAFSIREKLARYEALSELKETAKSKFQVAEPKTDADKIKNKLVDIYFEELKATYARESTLNSKKRIDGRGYADIRPINCEVGLLPRVHGTGLFTRGETQVLSAVTLGTSDDEQKIDAITGVYQKTFMLHYNFPPFSVGEARPNRPPGRREIGHGFLAERALSYVIPTKEVFPYTIRVVAEVLESNGSSSMASVCSGSLALMDAGVPIPKAVAGVAMGLIKEGNKVAVLSDILGDEDHLGDMDFKVCGTSEGVTAFQMDLKIGGVSREIMEQALSQARDGRLHVLEKMNAVLAQPRSEFSKYAPRIYTIKVKPDKVREVIGSGGKVIRGIIEQTGVKIDIEDDGSVHIASADQASAQKAIEIIQGIVEEPEIGKIYEGRVSRIAEFGAFVEIIPGTDGLVHISELEHYRVRRVEDVVKEGDIIKVKCLDVDSQGKIRLSRKALLPKDGGEGGEGSGGGAPREGRENREPRAPREAREPRGEAQEIAGEGEEDEGESIGNRVDAPRFGGPRREMRDEGGRGETREGRGDRGGRGGFGRGDRDGGRRHSGGGRGGGDRGGRGGGGREMRDSRDRGGESRRRDWGGGGGNDRGNDRGGDRGNDRGADRGGRSGGFDRGDRGERGMSTNRDRGERGGDRGGDRSRRGPGRGPVAETDSEGRPVSRDPRFDDRVDRLEDMGRWELEKAPEDSGGEERPWERSERERGGRNESRPRAGADRFGGRGEDRGGRSSSAPRFRRRDEFGGDE